MDFIWIFSVILVVMGFNGLFRMVVMKQSPLHRRHAHVEIKRPVFVRRFFLIKHTISIIAGIAWFSVFAILKDPFFVPMAYMALSLYIGVEMISIWVVGKYT